MHESAIWNMSNVYTRMGEKYNNNGRGFWFLGMYFVISSVLSKVTILNLFVGDSGHPLQPC